MFSSSTAASDTFEVSKKLILNKRGKIFLMPTGDPAREIEDYFEDEKVSDNTGHFIQFKKIYPKSIEINPNMLVIHLRDQALKQHPEWIKEIDLLPLSFAFMMYHNPASLDLLKLHPDIGHFLSNRILTQQQTALHIAIDTKNFSIAQWLIENVDFDLSMKYSGREDYIQYAMHRCEKITAWLIGREQTPLQTVDGMDYLSQAAETNQSILKVFLNSGRKFPAEHLQKALSIACHRCDEETIQSLLALGASPVGLAAEAISFRNMAALLALMRSPEFMINPADIQEAININKNARYRDDDFFDYGYDDRPISRSIKYAVCLFDITQRTISRLKEQKENGIDERSDINIAVINDLICDISKIDLPVSCCLQYLSKIMDAIQISQGNHAGTTKAITFFTECYVKIAQHPQHTEAQTLRGLLEKTEEKTMVRSCFNLFFKTHVSAKLKTSVRNALYQALHEDLKTLDAPDQMVLKKKAVTWGYPMFVEATSGHGEGTRGLAMKKEVDRYEKSHGKLLI